jgi:hypothetical protein
VFATLTAPSFARSTPADAWQDRPAAPAATPGRAAAHATREELISRNVAELVTPP